MTASLFKSNGLADMRHFPSILALSAFHAGVCGSAVHSMQNFLVYPSRECGVYAAHVNKTLHAVFLASLLHQNVQFQNIPVSYRYIKKGSIIYLYQYRPASNIIDEALTHLQPNTGKKNNLTPKKYYKVIFFLFSSRLCVPVVGEVVGGLVVWPCNRQQSETWKCKDNGHSCTAKLCQK
jgi:hypothetical protein